MINLQNNNSQNTNNQQNTPNYFDNEYRFTKGNWSLDKDRVNQPFGQNDEQGYNINPEDYTIVKINPAKSRWRVVTTKNGYQAWCNIKGHYHPIHYDQNLMQNTSDNFVWFDKCSDFLGSDNPYAKGYGGIFRKKEKRHFAVGLKDNRSYKVYADGEYEPYNDIHNYSETDAQGNKTTGNYYTEGKVNSDGTYTTSFIQDPNNQKEFDPNKFIRVRFDDRSLMQKFYYIWGNTMNNSNRGSNLKAGFNDNDQDQYFFIDMPNGPGIYDYVISLYDNLQNGTIKYNEIDKNVYRDVRSQTPGKRQNPYDFSIPNNPAQYTPIREDIENNNTTEEQNKERPEIIVFGNRIESQNNFLENLPDPKTIYVDPNDKLYGLFINNNQQKFYYRFNDQYVYIATDNPYTANNLIGTYEIKGNILNLIIYKSGTEYDINYILTKPQTVYNKQTQQPVGTMQFWELTAQDRDPFDGALNEQQIKKITKQIINEYVYGKKM